MSFPTRLVLGFSLITLTALATASWLADESSLPTATAAIAAVAADGDAIVAKAATVRDGDRQAVEISTAAKGVYAALPGTRMTFAMDVALSTVMRTGEQRDVANSQQYLWSGSIDLEVVDRRDQELVISVVPALEVQVVSNGQSVDPTVAKMIAGQIQGPLLVRMRDDGTVLGWRFPEAMTAEGRLQMRSLWSLGRFLVPSPLQSSWRLEETDPTGDCTVDYRLAACSGSRIDVLRSRTDRSLHGEGIAVNSPALSRDSSRASFDTELGWFVEVHCDESLQADVKEFGICIDATQRTNLVLHRQSWQPPTAQADLWSTEWSDPNGAAEMVAFHQASHDAQDLALVSDASIADLLMAIDGAIRTGGLADRTVNDQRVKLAAFLRLRGWDAGQLRSRLTDGTLSADAAATVLSALGAAGTPQSQSVLASIVSDGMQSEELRAKAMFASHQLETPGPELTTAIATHLDGQADAPLRIVALLLLGTCAGRDTTLLPALLARETQALADGIGAAYAESLRNAGQWGELERLATVADEPARRRAIDLVAAR